MTINTKSLVESLHNFLKRSPVVITAQIKQDETKAQTAEHRNSEVASKVSYSRLSVCSHGHYKSIKSCKL